ncbi:MAG: hypothetical protein NVS1B11_35870 [Terriglobales bacterium]
MVVEASNQQSEYVVKRPNKKLFPRVKLIPPTHESARDEGPRLIPLNSLNGDKIETSDYFLGLADTFLSRSDICPQISLSQISVQEVGSANYFLGLADTLLYGSEVYSK